MLSAMPRDLPRAFRMLSRSFGTLTAAQRLSGQRAEDAEGFRIFPEGTDVVTMSGRQHGQDVEGVRKFISASKFCSRPKFRRGNFLMSGTCGNTRKGLGMIKTVCGG